MWGVYACSNQRRTFRPALSFYLVGFRAQTQVFRLVHKCPYLLSWPRISFKCNDFPLLSSKTQLKCPSSMVYIPSS